MDQHGPFVAVKRYRIPGELVQNFGDQRRKDDAAAFLYLFLPNPPLDMSADVGACNGQQTGGCIRFDENPGNFWDIPVWPDDLQNRFYSFQQ